jgi:hypothetical protein
MFSVVGASAFLPFLPMAPIQVLTNNLLYDFSQVPIPADAVDEEQVTKPKALEHRGNQAVHSLYRSHQLDFRLHDFLRHALDIQLLGSIPSVAISDRLVRRVVDDADAHHPRHSYK